MLSRRLQDTIIKSLKTYPVVGIVGPRQSGKTTLAKAIQVAVRQETVYLDLELPSDQSKLQDPELYLSRLPNALVIIDEIQRMPSLFPLLRALVDQHRVGGRFLILGSSSPHLSKHASESLAGRIIYHELTPFCLDETGSGEFQNLWFKGGYPESFLLAEGEESHLWREAFIKTYLEMDLPQLGVHVPSANLRRFWSILAHTHGQLWNGSKMAGSLGITGPTAKKYLDILEDTFIVRQLQPYHANVKKRLVKASKVYIRDSGLLHAILGIRSLEDLWGHPVLGSSWEGFIIEQIISLLPTDRQPFFYRTAAGAEIDLVLCNSRADCIAIEIKYSLSPRLERGFRHAYEDLSCKKGIVIYPGEESYPLGDNVITLPVKDILRLLEMIT